MSSLVTRVSVPSIASASISLEMVSRAAQAFVFLTPSWTTIVCWNFPQLIRGMGADGSCASARSSFIVWPKKIEPTWLRTAVRGNRSGGHLDTRNARAFAVAVLSH